MTEANQQYNPPNLYSNGTVLQHQVTGEIFRVRQARKFCKDKQLSLAEYKSSVDQFLVYGDKPVAIGAWFIVDTFI